MSSEKTIPQFNTAGVAAGTFEVTVVLPKVQKDLVTQACNIYLNNLRQGNANTKDKGDVAGGGRKPWKQKGTGRARQGSTRSPQWRHGGIAHGPHTAEHRQEFPAAMAGKALKMALTDRLLAGKLFVVESAKGAKFLKSKEVATTLATIVPKGRVSLIVESSQNSLARGARNLAGVKVFAVSNLNAYDIVTSDFIILGGEAATKLFKKV